MWLRIAEGQGSEIVYMTSQGRKGGKDLIGTGKVHSGENLGRRLLVSKSQSSTGGYLYAMSIWVP